MLGHTDSTWVNRPSRGQFVLLSAYCHWRIFVNNSKVWPKPCTHTHNQLNLGNYSQESNHGQLLRPSLGSSAWHSSYFNWAAKADSENHFYGHRHIHTPTQKHTYTPTHIYITIHPSKHTHTHTHTHTW